MLNPTNVVYDNVSPLDYRYRNEELFRRCLSGRAEIAYQLLVEQEVVRVLRQYGQCSDEDVWAVEAACARVSAEDVAVEERRIKHNIRALVKCIQALVGPATKSKVHFGLTSFDVIDTAISMRVRDALELFLLPGMIRLENTLIGLAHREARTFQMGRTHGQHAVPITFGFAIAGHVSRLGGRIVKLTELANEAPGMISGAVGGYHSTSLFLDDPFKFEAMVLSSLGLRQLDHSTQIVQPEWMADVMSMIISVMGILADLADNMRHLQRTEIAEVGELFEDEQVGSSTMPHKRNPWNFENVKSMWKAFVSRIMTVFMDQLSEHQRDLTNSASGRFNFEILAALAEMLERLNRIMQKLVVDKEQMTANLAMTGDLFMAEPAHLLLAALGHPDSYEVVRRYTLEVERMRKAGEPATLLSLFWADDGLIEYRECLTPAQIAVLLNPQMYKGKAVERTEAICEHWAVVTAKVESGLKKLD